jgi:protein-ribulosamine 3-kinase
MTDFARIARHISEASGQPFDPDLPRSVGGGCINTAVKLSDGDRHWFVKLNRASMLDMFEAEYAGLQAMADTGTIRVPRPLCTGSIGGDSYIVMEHIDLGGAKAGGQAQAGEQLAAMHRHQAAQFGWQRDNTIGATPQPNTWRQDWIEFFRDQRLGFQLQLAARNGYGGRLQALGERLLDAFPVLIDHDPAPSLLHGDLWGGNMGFDSEGNPVIYDPATYYGDREADLAMTELFGGLGGEFHAAYNDAWPLDAGYKTRKTLYNLYHILNHLNLFGSGYAGQAQGMMERLLAETG